MITYEFHVRRSCRDKYSIDSSLFTVTGDLIIANFYQARLLAQKINDERVKEGKTDKLVTPGMLNGLGLLHEIFHFILRHYETVENPGVFARSISFLKNNIGEQDLDRLLLIYLNDFPAAPILNGETTPEKYLSGSTEGKPNREILIEELLLLNLSNENPAAVLLEELFSDKELAVKSSYLKFISGVERFFITEKPFGPSNLPLTQFLKAPLKLSPLSLEGQLDFVRENWGIYIYDKFNERLLSGKDLIREDNLLFIKYMGFSKPSPGVPTYEFDRDYFEMLRRRLEAGEALTDAELQYYQSETERFTADIDWMPRVVMMAKNVFVWMFQLTRKYGRDITRLDQIPDEELDQLARWNFTALWLIGLWERSSASRKIKQYMGNPEAAASAYSLYDYVIAGELGGEPAFNNLKERAWRRGIRMASDMVPNHTGIFSKWVVEKPDYFIQTEYPPYPGYTFNSGNLSDDNRVEVRIEDKYYNHSDAAVVFQRRDSYTGSVRYIYHGNDGTHMPWNDTAQLNLLNPEVRESLIQTIMHVARMTPIIRFDAAMTLSKKHYQRLWFPIPGTGGGIPSRSDFAMSRSRFDEAMPEEFWREVVDRINNEMPQTLLLAEAFWLMESYFVRTLGMHRVYNSAFMHMLMKEENEKYRLLIKNTLSFNPEILKRYVNFMSNPDEETAVNQFGKGDKYFGTAVVMITLPGLPMFGHGQIEGFSEKYGMEYKRAYYDEPVDDHLVQRHREEIFPLLAKRHLFSQVNFFEFYDFIDDNGNVVENVFAYSNRAGGERALIIYNNSYGETRGTVKYAVHKAASGPDIQVHSKLGEALDINPGWKFYYIYRDHRAHLEYLISGYDLMESGIYLYLAGYQYAAFTEFREVYDELGDYERLRIHLSGRGVPSVQNAMEELQLTPFHNAVKQMFSHSIRDNYNAYTSGLIKGFPDNVAAHIRQTLETVNHYRNLHFDTQEILTGVLNKIGKLRDANIIIRNEGKKQRKAAWLKNMEKVHLNNGLILPYIILSEVSRRSQVKQIYKQTRMDNALYAALKDNDLRIQVPLLDVLTSEITSFSHNGKAKEKVSAAEKVADLLKNEKVCLYLSVNTWEGVTYYSKERFEEFIRWYFIGSLLESEKSKTGEIKTRKKSVKAVRSEDKTKEITDRLKRGAEFMQKVLSASDEAGYTTMGLLKILSAEKAAVKKSGKKVRPVKKIVSRRSKKSG